MSAEPGDQQTTANEQSQQSSMKIEGSASFLRAARAGNLDKVLELLRSGTDINTCNANGLNALHLASKEGHNEVVRELLKRKAHVDAATKKGNTALHIASLAGQSLIVTILVENGANVNVQSLNGFTPLYMAAQENHEDVVRFLLDHGANQTLSTEDGFTPLAVALQQGHDRVVAILLENNSRGKVRLPALHIAAKKDDIKAATLLMENEHNPDVTSKSGFTPLHIAAHYGNENVAQLLIERGANVNYQARHNISPLHVATKWGRLNMVQLLLQHGAIIDSRTRDLLTPLHCAARSGHDQVVDMLLEKGAPISAKTKNGLAPLHMAAQGDHVDSARILLYHRAPVDDVTVDYLTPLHVAAHCGHVRVAKLLLDRSADPNARALNGFTPLHIACKKNRIKVVELLLKYHAAIEATTESGLSPLHVASFMGAINIVIYLLQQGANADVATVRGETPLHLAARANQTDVVRVLIRNGAKVDAQARELQTPLHIASRLGNTDIVVLLLQAGANPNAATRDQYTSLHIAAKEGQEEVAHILLDHKAEMSVLTKKGFTPLHLASKYGNVDVVKLLLDRGCPVDVEGKNQVTPLHVAAHYNNDKVAMLLLEKGASAKAAAKNGYTPLHIAAKKNQMEIASTLLQFNADPNAKSRAGFTPLHLAAQEGHREISGLLIESGSNVGAKANNGLTAMHLCAQEDHVSVAEELANHGADINSQTNAGYTPLHVACHFGQLNMVKFLVERGAHVGEVTRASYTPLHQAAQQGHNHCVKFLLENGASPNAQTATGQTPLSIAQRLGYVSVVETLKTVTETTVITETTTVTDERYKPQNPEGMNETMFSESEDEGQAAEHETVNAHMKDFSDHLTQGLSDSTGVHMIHTGEQLLSKSAELDGMQLAPSTHANDNLDELIRKAQNQPLYAAAAGTATHDESVMNNTINDNIPIGHNVAQPRFLISFLVDARGGAMRGCRHSGVRIIVPPRKAAQPVRVTCRYLRKEKLAHPPPLSEGEELASRILEMAPAGAKFLGPVILEVPHFASLRDREREIVILRSDDGQHWKEHQLEATEDAVQEVLNESFDAEELAQLDDLHTPRITRILTNDFPMYFAVVTRVRQEVHCVGPEGGVIMSSVVPRVQAIFPDGSLTKTIKVSVQAQPVPQEMVTRLHGNRVAVSPIVTVEPRRRKFHKPITLCIPLPQSSNKGMLTQYSGQPGQEPPTLRLLCSITGGSAPAQWEDITGTTQLTFTGDEVNFTTTVSARFWLMDCQTPRDAARMAQEVYNEAISIPYMAKFAIFARRTFPIEGQLRVFCMTDDKEDKTLEKQEHFKLIAKSKDVEVLKGKHQFLEFSGNLMPVTKSGDQLSLYFIPFQENRLAFMIKTKNKDNTEVVTEGRISFMKEPKLRSDSLAPQSPICTLAVTLPEYGSDIPAVSKQDVTPFNEKYKGAFDEELPVFVHSNVLKAVGPDWSRLARALELPHRDIQHIRQNYPGKELPHVLKIWIHLKKTDANQENLDSALRRIGRDDIVRSIAHGDTDTLNFGSDSPSSKQFETAKLADVSSSTPLKMPIKENVVEESTAFASKSDTGVAKEGPVPQLEQAEPVSYSETNESLNHPIPEEEEPISEIRTVVRTERHVHDTDQGPIVEERTITTTYEDDVAVNENIVDRRVPLNEEEQTKWQELNRLAEEDFAAGKDPENVDVPAKVDQHIEKEQHQEDDGTIVTTVTTVLSHITDTENEPTTTDNHAGTNQDELSDQDGSEQQASATSDPTADSGTTQKKETAEEGFTNEDGSVVVSKKMTRVVTTTRTTLPGDSEQTPNDDSDETVVSVKDRIAKFEAKKDIQLTPASVNEYESSFEDQNNDADLEPLKPSTYEIATAEVKKQQVKTITQENIISTLEHREENSNLQLDLANKADIAAEKAIPSEGDEKLKMKRDVPHTTYESTSEETRKSFDEVPTQSETTFDQPEHEDTPSSLAHSQIHSHTSQVVESTEYETVASGEKTERKTDMGIEKRIAEVSNTEVPAALTENDNVEEEESEKFTDKMLGFTKKAGLVAGAAVASPVALAALGAHAAYEKLKNEESGEEHDVSSSSYESRSEETRKSFDRVPTQAEATFDQPQHEDVEQHHAILSSPAHSEVDSHTSHVVETTETHETSFQPEEDETAHEAPTKVETTFDQSEHEDVEDQDLISSSPAHSEIHSHTSHVVETTEIYETSFQPEEDETAHEVTTQPKATFDQPEHEDVENQDLISSSPAHSEIHSHTSHIVDSTDIHETSFQPEEDETAHEVTTQAEATFDRPEHEDVEDHDLISGSPAHSEIHSHTSHVVETTEIHETSFQPEEDETAPAVTTQLEATFDQPEHEDVEEHDLISSSPAHSEIHSHTSHVVETTEIHETSFQPEEDETAPAVTTQLEATFDQPEHEDVEEHDLISSSPAHSEIHSHTSHVVDSTDIHETSFQPEEDETAHQVPTQVETTFDQSEHEDVEDHHIISSSPAHSEVHSHTSHIVETTEIHETSFQPEEDETAHEVPTQVETTFDQSEHEDVEGHHIISSSPAHSEVHSHTSHIVETTEIHETAPAVPTQVETTFDQPQHEYVEEHDLISSSPAHSEVHSHTSHVVETTEIHETTFQPEEDETAHEVTTQPEATFDQPEHEDVEEHDLIASSPAHSEVQSHTPHIVESTEIHETSFQPKEDETAHEVTTQPKATFDQPQHEDVEAHDLISSSPAHSEVHSHTSHVVETTEIHETSFQPEEDETAPAVTTQPEATFDQPEHEDVEEHDLISSSPAHLEVQSHTPHIVESTEIHETSFQPKEDETAPAVTTQAETTFDQPEHDDVEDHHIISSSPAHSEIHSHTSHVVETTEIHETSFQPEEDETAPAVTTQPEATFDQPEHEDVEEHDLISSSPAHSEIHSHTSHIVESTAYGDDEASGEKPESEIVAEEESEKFTDKMLGFAKKAGLVAGAAVASPVALAALGAHAVYEKLKNEESGEEHDVSSSSYESRSEETRKSFDRVPTQAEATFDQPQHEDVEEHHVILSSPAHSEVDSHTSHVVETTEIHETSFQPQEDKTAHEVPTQVETTFDQPEHEDVEDHHIISSSPAHSEIHSHASHVVETTEIHETSFQPEEDEKAPAVTTQPEATFDRPEHEDVEDHDLISSSPAHSEVDSHTSHVVETTEIHETSFQPEEDETAPAVPTQPEATFDQPQHEDVEDHDLISSSPAHSEVDSHTSHVVETTKIHETFFQPEEDETAHEVTTQAEATFDRPEHEDVEDHDLISSSPAHSEVHYHTSHVVETTEIHETSFQLEEDEAAPAVTTQAEATFDRTEHEDVEDHHAISSSPAHSEIHSHTSHVVETTEIHQTSFQLEEDEAAPAVTTQAEATFDRPEHEDVEDHDLISSSLADSEIHSHTSHVVETTEIHETSFQPEEDETDHEVPTQVETTFDQPEHEDVEDHHIISSSPAHSEIHSHTSHVVETTEIHETSFEPEEDEIAPAVTTQAETTFDQPEHEDVEEHDFISSSPAHSEVQSHTSHVVETTEIHETSFEPEEDEIAPAVTTQAEATFDRTEHEDVEDHHAISSSPAHSEIHSHTSHVVETTEIHETSFQPEEDETDHEVPTQVETTFDQPEHEDVEDHHIISSSPAHSEIHSHTSHVVETTEIHETSFEPEEDEIAPAVTTQAETTFDQPEHEDVEDHDLISSSPAHSEVHSHTSHVVDSTEYGDDVTSGEKPESETVAEEESEKFTDKMLGFAKKAGLVAGAAVASPVALAALGAHAVYEKLKNEESGEEHDVSSSSYESRSEERGKSFDRVPTQAEATFDQPQHEDVEDHHVIPSSPADSEVHSHTSHVVETTEIHETSFQPEEDEKAPAVTTQPEATFDQPQHEDVEDHDLISSSPAHSEVHSHTSHVVETTEIHETSFQPEEDETAHEVPTQVETTFDQPEHEDVDDHHIISSSPAHSEVHSHISHIVDSTEINETSFQPEEDETAPAVTTQAKTTFDQPEHEDVEDHHIISSSPTHSEVQSHTSHVVETTEIHETSFQPEEDETAHEVPTQVETTFDQPEHEDVDDHHIISSSPAHSEVHSHTSHIVDSTEINETSFQPEEDETAPAVTTQAKTTFDQPEHEDVDDHHIISSSPAHSEVHSHTSHIVDSTEINETSFQPEEDETAPAVTTQAETTFDQPEHEDVEDHHIISSSPAHSEVHSHTSHIVDSTEIHETSFQPEEDETAPAVTTQAETTFDQPEHEDVEGHDLISSSPAHSEVHSHTSHVDETTEIHETAPAVPTQVETTFDQPQHEYVEEHDLISSSPAHSEIHSHTSHVDETTEIHETSFQPEEDETASAVTTQAETTFDQPEHEDVEDHHIISSSPAHSEVHSHTSHIVESTEIHETSFQPEEDETASAVTTQAEATFDRPEHEDVEDHDLISSSPAHSEIHSHTSHVVETTEIHETSFQPEEDETASAVTTQAEITFDQPEHEDVEEHHFISSSPAHSEVQSHTSHIVESTAYGDHEASGEKPESEIVAEEESEKFTDKMLGFAKKAGLVAGAAVASPVALAALGAHAVYEKLKNEESGEEHDVSSSSYESRSEETRKSFDRVPTQAEATFDQPQHEDVEEHHAILSSPTHSEVHSHTSHVVDTTETHETSFQPEEEETDHEVPTQVETTFDQPEHEDVEDHHVISSSPAHSEVHSHTSHVVETTETHETSFQPEEDETNHEVPTQVETTFEQPEHEDVEDHHVISSSPAHSEVHSHTSHVVETTETHETSFQPEEDETAPAVTTQPEATFDQPEHEDVEDHDLIASSPAHSEIHSHTSHVVETTETHETSFQPEEDETAHEVTPQPEATFDQPEHEDVEDHDLISSSPAHSEVHSHTSHVVETTETHETSFQPEEDETAPAVTTQPEATSDQPEHEDVEDHHVISSSPAHSEVHSHTSHVVETTETHETSFQPEEDETAHEVTPQPEATFDQPEHEDVEDHDLISSSPAHSEVPSHTSHVVDSTEIHETSFQPEEDETAPAVTTQAETTFDQPEHEDVDDHHIISSSPAHSEVPSHTSHVVETTEIHETSFQPEEDETAHEVPTQVETTFDQPEHEDVEDHHVISSSPAHSEVHSHTSHVVETTEIHETSFQPEEDETAHEVPTQVETSFDQPEHEDVEDHHIISSSPAHSEFQSHTSHIIESTEYGDDVTSGEKLESETVVEEESEKFTDKMLGFAKKAGFVAGAAVASPVALAALGAHAVYEKLKNEESGEQHDVSSSSYESRSEETRKSFDRVPGQTETTFNQPGHEDVEDHHLISSSPAHSEVQSHTSHIVDSTEIHETSFQPEEDETAFAVTTQAETTFDQPEHEDVEDHHVISSSPAHSEVHSHISHVVETTEPSFQPQEDETDHEVPTQVETTFDQPEHEDVEDHHVISSSPAHSEFQSHTSHVVETTEPSFQPEEDETASAVTTQAETTFDHPEHKDVEDHHVISSSPAHSEVQSHTSDIIESTEIHETSFQPEEDQTASAVTTQAETTIDHPEHEDVEDHHLISSSPAHSEVQSHTSHIVESTEIHETSFQPEEDETASAVTTQAETTFDHPEHKDVEDHHVISSSPAHSEIHSHTSHVVETTEIHETSFQPEEDETAPAVTTQAETTFDQPEHEDVEDHHLISSSPAHSEVQSHTSHIVESTEIHETSFQPEEDEAAHEVQTQVETTFDQPEHEDVEDHHAISSSPAHSEIHSHTSRVVETTEIHETSFEPEEDETAPAVTTQAETTFDQPEHEDVEDHHLISSSPAYSEVQSHTSHIVESTEIHETSFQPEEDEAAHEVQTQAETTFDQPEHEDVEDHHAISSSPAHSEIHSHTSHVVETTEIHETSFQPEEDETDHEVPTQVETTFDQPEHEDVEDHHIISSSPAHSEVHSHTSHVVEATEIHETSFQPEKDETDHEVPTQVEATFDQPQHEDVEDHHLISSSPVHSVHSHTSPIIESTAYGDDVTSGEKPESETVLEEESEKFTDKMLGFTKKAGLVAGAAVAAPVALAALGAHAVYEKLKNEESGEERDVPHAYYKSGSESSSSHIVDSTKIREASFQPEEDETAPAVPTKAETTFDQPQHEYVEDHDLFSSSPVHSEVHSHTSPLVESTDGHKTLIHEELSQSQDALELSTEKSTKNVSSVPEESCLDDSYEVLSGGAENVIEKNEETTYEEFEEIVNECVSPVHEDFEKIVAENEDTFDSSVQNKYYEEPSHIVESTDERKASLHLLEEKAFDNVNKMKFSEESELISSPDKQVVELISSAQIDELSEFVLEDEWKVFDNSGVVVEEFSAELTDELLNEVVAQSTFPTDTDSHKPLLKQESYNEVAMEHEVDYQSDLQEKLEILASQSREELIGGRLDDHLHVILESDLEIEAPESSSAVENQNQLFVGDDESHEPQVVKDMNEMAEDQVLTPEDVEDGFVLYNDNLMEQNEGDGELETVEEEAEDSDSINGSGNSSVGVPSDTVILVGKYRNVSSDNVSLNSLQEFERLEQLVANRGDHSLTSSEIELYAASRLRSAEGSVSSLAEFEKLEQELISQGPNHLSPQDEMMLSVVKEESEAEDMSIRDDDEYENETENDTIIRVQNQDSNRGTPIGTSLADSLEQINVCSSNLETSTDSLQVGAIQNEDMEESLEDYDSKSKLQESFRDSLENITNEKDSLLEGASQDMASQETRGMLSGETLASYQDHDEDDKDSLGGEMDNMLACYPTTLTTFETTSIEADGTMKKITRRVETRVRDPVKCHVAFTGTEDESRLRELSLGEQVETVDSEGNVTRTTISRHSTNEI